MRTRSHRVLYFAVIISLLTCLIALALRTHEDLVVNAQGGCTVPKTSAQTGDSLRPRWAAGQEVTVIAYPGHFTSQEISAMDAILDEFEPGGSVGCAMVVFNKIVEGEFSLTNNPVGNPAAANTLYLIKKPVSQMPNAAGSQQGRGKSAVDQNGQTYNRYTNAQIAI